MTRKYEIWLEKRIIALGYISSHPYFEDKRVASVFPITRTKNMQEISTEIAFGPLAHENFSVTQSDEEMIRELMAPVIDGVTTKGYTIVPVNLREESET
jgi:hypothetical protein